jgi:hypothetical protein
MFTELNISPVKPACVDRTDQLPDGQLGSSLENGVLDSMHERSSWISVTQACPNNLCQLRGSPQDLGCYSGPRIELAGDAVDAWKLVSPFISEEIL